MFSLLDEEILGNKKAISREKTRLEQPNNLKLPKVIIVGMNRKGCTTRVWFALREILMSGDRLLVRAPDLKGRNNHGNITMGYVVWEG